MSYEYPKSISEAAILLDKAFLNWDKKINLNILDMTDGGKCILGQLYPSYARGIEVLFNIDMEDCKYPLVRDDCIFGTLAVKHTWIEEIESRSGNNFTWAVEQLKAGHKVKRKTWTKTVYWQNHKNHNHIVNQVNNVPVFHIDHLIANDWILYKEPLMLTTISPGQKFKQPNKIETYTKLKSSFSALTHDWSVVNWSEDVEVELV